MVHPINVTKVEPSGEAGPCSVHPHTADIYRLSLSLRSGFFISHLCHFFTNNIGGQSMQAGGAMLLAENGVAPHIIQGIGRWASSVWQIYIYKHPILLQAMLHA
jgi:hypothetical protein